MIVFIYIIATASHSKTIPHNRLKMCVVKYKFFSSAILYYDILILYANNYY